ncbi:hypothetical protein [Sandaracinobacter sp.]|uniref:hypothetical protein n=1 Tax=Sandaracinobacter sp. TaxID=2487581 RepID=UPI0035AE2D8D
MIDLHTPRYSGAEAAKACGIPVTTFRSYFARGHFRVFGDARERDANGLPHQFSLRDIVGLAIAIRLMDSTSITPASAFNVGMKFAHMGNNCREPGRAFNFHEFGETAILYWPQSDRSRIMPFDKLTLHDLAANEKAVSVLLVNHAIGDVYKALGLDPMVAVIGSEPPADASDWEEIGEIVSE